MTYYVCRSVFLCTQGFYLVTCIGVEGCVIVLEQKDRQFIFNNRSPVLGVKGCALDGGVVRALGVGADPVESHVSIGGDGGEPVTTANQIDV